MMRSPPTHHRSHLLTLSLVVTLLGGCSALTTRPSPPSQASSNTGVSQLEESTADGERLTPAFLTKLSKVVPGSNRVASHNRMWRPEYAVLPIVELDSVHVRIRNVRNNKYRSSSDYDVRFYDMSFPLAAIQSVDFIVVPFKSTDLLAHTMLSFGLQDGRYFVVSVEARLEQDESYSTTGGAKGDFELMYVVGDERDLILLRTQVRQVDCYAYPGIAGPAEAQRLFVDIANRINQIAAQPELYHTFKNNCTTNLVDHVNRVFPNRIPYNWKILLPGRSDSLAYDLKLLDLPAGDFDKVKPFYRINALAHIHENSPEFSQGIRSARRLIGSPMFPHAIVNGQ